VYEVCNENIIDESLPNLRDAYPKTELLRNAAHHRVRSAIADLFRIKNLEVYEEVHCQRTNDGITQNRRADIVVLDRMKKTCAHLRPNNSLGNK